MGSGLAMLGGLAHLLAAIAALALAGWLMPRRKGAGRTSEPTAAGLLLTACWALAQAGFGAAYPATLMLLGLANLAWLWLLYRLFAIDARDRLQGPVRPVVLALALVELLQLALVAALLAYHGQAQVEQLVLRFGLTFRLLFCAGALFLVHNLYASASSATREMLRWPTSALGLMWLYDLNLATVAYLDDAMPQALIQGRALAMLAMAGLLALGAARPADAGRFSPSRSFAFSSFSLLAIGGYLVAMVLVTQGLGWLGSDLAWLVQAGFLATAGALALAVLPSARLRGLLRVTLTKHLFQHRYDYRAEWLRFTDTLGRAGPQAPPLHQRIVQAVADITDSPGGLLLLPADDGGLASGAQWQWAALEAPALALAPSGTRFFEQSQFIVDLDDLRAGRADRVPADACPPWLLAQGDAWALVPLLHYERLVGLVVLARPPLSRRLDWEDFDLLRVVGRQLASYLAEQASHDALAEAQRFEEFNRRIAFVMHDIKNLTSQLSLLARNAERHADNPEFRADMLVTLRNSAEKLEGLLARLGRYRAHGAETLAPVDLLPVLRAIAARYASQHPVIVVDHAPCAVLADREGLEQALVHLVHNAVEASQEGAPVLLDLRINAAGVAVEVVDSGPGMSAEFIRTRLFRPFNSSKPGGFGIGAFEARELVRAMGGRLDVESREGLGTRFLLTLPLARSGGAINPADLNLDELKVA